jgi:hypothetical protein
VLNFPVEFAGIVNLCEVIYHNDTLVWDFKKLRRRKALDCDVRVIIPSSEVDEQVSFILFTPWSKDIVPLIFKIGTRWSEWLISRFNPVKAYRYPFNIILGGNNLLPIKVKWLVQSDGNLFPHVTFL